tara:strand:+ start:365 stop:532 length:168 start_codon:yes stop_codon:yes gene_type:complete
MTNKERINSLKEQLKTTENQYFKIQGAIEVLEGIEMEKMQNVKQEKPDGKAKAKK